MLTIQHLFIPFNFFSLILSYKAVLGSIQNMNQESDFLGLGFHSTFGYGVPSHFSKSWRAYLSEGDDYSGIHLTELLCG